MAWSVVQPSKTTRYSDSDLSYTTLATHTDVNKYSVFLRTIRDWNSLDRLSDCLSGNSSVNLQLTSAVNAMHPSSYWQRPLLGRLATFRSTEVLMVIGHTVGICDIVYTFYTRGTL